MLGSIRECFNTFNDPNGKGGEIWEKSRTFRKKSNLGPSKFGRFSWLCSRSTRFFTLDAPVNLYFGPIWTRFMTFFGFSVIFLQKNMYFHCRMDILAFKNPFRELPISIPSSLHDRGSILEKQKFHMFSHCSIFVPGNVQIQLSLGSIHLLFLS